MEPMTKTGSPLWFNFDPHHMWPWVKKPGQPPVNIPIPTKTTKIGSKMGGAPTPKRDPIGFEPQPRVCVCVCKWFAEICHFKGIILVSQCIGLDW